MASLSIANFVKITAAHNIAAQGFTDWALWNAGSGSNATSKAPAQRKSGGGSLIGNLTCSVAQLEAFTAALFAISWTGGTPTASGSNTNGEFNNLNSSGTSTNGANCSWTFTGIGTGTYTCRVYLGAFASNVTIAASLSDGSAGPASNTSMTNGQNDGADTSFGYLDITVSAGSAGQTLTVTATAAAAGFAQFSDVEPFGAGIIVPAAGTTLTPAQVALTLAGQTPTLAQTANQSVSPAQVALTLTGRTPTLAQTANQAVSPASASLTITGQTPTLQQTAGFTVIPAAVSVALTGQVPTLAQSANQSVSPSAGAVTITGQIPTIVQASGSLTLTPAPAVLAILGPVPSFVQSGQDPYPLGSGGAPLEYYPSAFEIRDQARRERLDAWAREEQAITRRLQRKPRKPTLQPLDLPRPTFGERSETAETPTPIASPKAAAIAKAVQARRQAESPEAKAEKARIAQAEAQEQARKAEEERKTIERRARNRRRAMELAARFFFS